MAFPDAALVCALLLVCLERLGRRSKKHTVNTDVRPPVAPGGCCLCRDDPSGAPPGAGTQHAPSLRQLALSALFATIVGVVAFSDGHGHHLYLFANAPRRTLSGCWEWRC